MNNNNKKNCMKGIFFSQSKIKDSSYDMLNKE